MEIGQKREHLKFDVRFIFLNFLFLILRGGKDDNLLHVLFVNFYKFSFKI